MARPTSPPVLEYRRNCSYSLQSGPQASGLRLRGWPASEGATTVESAPPATVTATAMTNSLQIPNSIAQPAV
jgi:hypothetical protein